MQGKKTNKELTKKHPRLFYEEWLKHFAVWQASGESQANYCARHNLSLKAFKKQYSRSRQEGALAKNENTVSTPKPAGNFVPVKLVGASAITAIEFIFRSGVVMKIPYSCCLSSVLNSLKDYLWCATKAPLVLAAESAAKKVLTQHILYPALSLKQQCQG